MQSLGDPANAADLPAAAVILAALRQAQARNFTQHETSQAAAPSSTLPPAVLVVEPCNIDTFTHPAVQCLPHTSKAVSRQCQYCKAEALHSEQPLTCHHIAAMVQSSLCWPAHLTAIEVKAARPEQPNLQSALRMALLRSSPPVRASAMPNALPTLHGSNAPCCDDIDAQ